jgi:hypothetical protein
MKHHFFTLLLIIIFSSCSTSNKVIIRNNKLTDKLIHKIYTNNENVFFLRSSNATFSTLWSYVNNEIVIYKLANGKVISKKTHVSSNDKLDHIDLSNFNEINMDSAVCEYLLDGDLFGFILKDNDNIIDKSFPVEIECLKKAELKSSSMNIIINDIKLFKLWDVNYH